MQIVVMGVSGCGKSTVAEQLAQKLGARYIDADDLHPQSNRSKMAAGTPLTDEDRWPWLDLVGQALAEPTELAGTVIACSALKRMYRTHLRNIAPDVQFVHLHGSPELLAERIGARQGHFMKADMLASQLAILEPLAADEPGKTYDIALPLDQLVEAIASDFV